MAFLSPVDDSDRVQVLEAKALEQDKRIAALEAALEDQSRQRNENLHGMNLQIQRLALQIRARVNAAPLAAAPPAASAAAPSAPPAPAPAAAPPATAPAAPRAAAPSTASPADPAAPRVPPVPQFIQVENAKIKLSVPLDVLDEYEQRKQQQTSAFRTLELWEEWRDGVVFCRTVNCVVFLSSFCSLCFCLRCCFTFLCLCSRGCRTGGNEANEGHITSAKHQQNCIRVMQDVEYALGPKWINEENR